MHRQNVINEEMRRTVTFARAHFHQRKQTPAKMSPQFHRRIKFC